MISADANAGKRRPRGRSHRLIFRSQATPSAASRRSVAHKEVAGALDDL